MVYTFGEDRPSYLRRQMNNMQTQTKENNQIRMKSDDDKLSYIYSKRPIPRHCSRYIISGQARYSWEHSVPSGSGRGDVFALPFEVGLDQKIITLAPSVRTNEQVISEYSSAMSILLLLGWGCASIIHIETMADIYKLCTNEDI